MNFKDLIDDPKILQALADQGYETATPIQEKAIPAILNGADLKASAQTGSGKTAAFLVPVLAKMAKDPHGKGPRLLILVPTRELAMQVSGEAIKLCKHLPFKVVCIFGGVPYPFQNKQLSKKYDILIATPGRLIDHLERGRIRLNHVETLILDEADRMLDMGFIEPVEMIASHTPSTRQTLMFSATFGKKVAKLAEVLLRDPVDVRIDAEMRTPDQIQQHLHRTNNLEHKHQLLTQSLNDPTVQQAIVFSSTKMQSEDIATILCDQGFKAACLHGDMNQRQRTRTIQQLREGKIRILVATDVAARGIDILTVSHVINFDLPRTLEDYVHRIGRTGRAGAKGTAISFASARDHHVRKEIEKFTGLSTGPDEKRRDFQNHRKKRPFHKKPFRRFHSKV